MAGPDHRSRVRVRRIRHEVRSADPVGDPRPGGGAMLRKTMTKMTIATAAGALTLTSGASAHVTLEPNEAPSPQVKVTAAEGETAATTPAGSSSAGGGDDSSDTLAIIALIVGGLGLLAGGAALATRRRA